MRANSKTLAALFLGSLLLSAAHAETAIRILHKEPLQQLRMAGPALTDRQRVIAEPARSLRFDALGQSFDISLEENRAILSPALREQLDKGHGVYRGEIAGMPGSWVRLVISDGLPRGMLWNGTEFMAIDVTFNSATRLDEAFIYRLSDMQIPAGALACGELGGAKNAAELAHDVISEFTASAAPGDGPMSRIDVAVIGDFEFTDSNGGGTISALTQRMNNVDGIFSMQLGVQVYVNRIDTFAANDDPFSDVSAAGDLLDELADYRRVTPQQNANGLTHLFTGRNLDDSTVGIAYTGALCSRGFGVGLTQGSNNIGLDSLVAAHEIGHNFGAIHDGEEQPCEDVPPIFLMAPQLNGSSEFSACSITSMQEQVSRASCVMAMPTTDVAIVATRQAAAVLLGNEETLTFEANNIGSEGASGVTLDVAIPSGVTLNSATATAGSCSSGAGNVSCQLGNVAAGSGATVSIGITASTVGEFDLMARVDADADTDSSNNDATMLLTVDPAVDLVATAGAPVQVALNGSTTIATSIENRASITATGVTVTITPQAGLSVDSASWAAGICSVAGNVVSCQANSLAPQSNNALQLGVTGGSAGNRTYSMAASAAEADRVPSDNDASGQVTVSAPPGSDPGNATASGGGALDWVFLMLTTISIVTARNRERRSHGRRVSQ